jgi:hypothetical protein
VACLRRVEDLPISDLGGFIIFPLGQAGAEIEETMHLITTRGSGRELQRREVTRREFRRAQFLLAELERRGGDRFDRRRLDLSRGRFPGVQPELSGGRGQEARDRARERMRRPGATNHFYFWM